MFVDVAEMSPSELEEYVSRAWQPPQLAVGQYEDQRRWYAPWTVTKEGNVELLAHPEVDYAEFHGVDPHP